MLSNLVLLQGAQKQMDLGKNTGPVHTCSSPPWGLFELGLNVKKVAVGLQASLDNQCSSLFGTAKVES